MNHHVYRIYRELMKKGVTFESITSHRNPRYRIIDQVTALFEKWQYHVDELLDIRNWHLDRLMLDPPEVFRRGNIHYESNIRRPKAYFDLTFTSKENRVSRWPPQGDRPRSALPA